MPKLWPTETFDPIFTQLDALIAAEWGDTPQNQIPENWQTHKPKKEQPRITRACNRRLLRELEREQQQLVLPFAFMEAVDEIERKKDLAVGPVKRKRVSRGLRAVRRLLKTATN